MNEAVESARWSQSKFDLPYTSLPPEVASKIIIPDAVEPDAAARDADLHAAMLDLISLALDDWPSLLSYVLGDQMDPLLNAVAPPELLRRHDQESLIFEGLITVPFAPPLLAEVRKMLSQDGRIDETTVTAVKAIYLNLPLIEAIGREYARQHVLDGVISVLAVMRQLPDAILLMGKQCGVSMQNVAREIWLWCRIAAGFVTMTDGCLAAYRADSMAAWNSLLLAARRQQQKPASAMPNAAVEPAGPGMPAARKGGRPQKSDAELLTLLKEFEAADMTQAEFSLEKGRGYSTGNLSVMLRKARGIRDGSENVRKTP